MSGERVRLERGKCPLQLFHKRILKTEANTTYLLSAFYADTVFVRRVIFAKIVQH